MNIVKWDPFGAFGFDVQERSRSWAPVVDIYEKGDDVVIRAELPGVNRDDIEVGVDKGVLTLSGERKIDKDVEEGTTYRRERFYGKFTRSFTLPDSVDASRIAAKAKDGVLEIRVPKAEQARPRRIEIELPQVGDLVEGRKVLLQRFHPRA